VQEVAVSGHLDADDGDILTQWAIDGEGIVMKPAFEAAEHLRAGTLQLVLRLSQSRSWSCTPISG
jgi:hypothetical protein